MNLTYMSAESMKSASRACRSTRHRSAPKAVLSRSSAYSCTWRQSGQVLQSWSRFLKHGHNGSQNCSSCPQEPGARCSGPAARSAEPCAEGCFRRSGRPFFARPLLQQHKLLPAGAPPTLCAKSSGRASYLPAPPYEAFTAAPTYDLATKNLAPLPRPQPTKARHDAPAVGKAPATYASISPH
jgi:hypothetical protein